MKALALFSGGLDSILAVKVIQAQGIEVVPINFVSYFFGGNNLELEKISQLLGTKIEFIDIKEKHLAMVNNPPNGYGKYMNPCIDCHAMMIRTAIDILPEYGASFIITGEVLGQRPMSQTTRSINLINKITGNTGLVVRPLSGQLLPATKPELDGWINRSQLLMIAGRGRGRQMELADQYGIKEYPSPAGGCPLTIDSYSDKLRLIQEDGMMQKTVLFEIIKFGRFFRLSPGKYIIVSRNEAENGELDKLKQHADRYITPALETYGPHILLIGENFTDNETDFAFRLFSRYSKVKGEADVDLDYSTTIIHRRPGTISDEEFNKYIVR